MENKKHVMFYIFKDTSIWSFKLRFIYIWFIFESDKQGKEKTNQQTVISWFGWTLFFHVLK